MKLNISRPLRMDECHLAKECLTTLLIGENVNTGLEGLLTLEYEEHGYKKNPLSKEL